MLPLQRNPEHAMGRPPIGKVAMTSTERSRRCREKLVAENAVLKTRVAELEQEIARLERPLGTSKEA
jgi:cell division protein FtsB